MARFERSSGRRNNRDSRDSRRGGGRRYPGRDSRGGSKNRRDIKMTKVTCSSCGNECEVPFKPTLNKPVFCSDCFTKQGKDSSDRPSNKNLEIINEKLDKIMEALNIK